MHSERIKDKLYYRLIVLGIFALALIVLAILLYFRSSNETELVKPSFESNSTEVKYIEDELIVAFTTNLSVEEATKLLKNSVSIDDIVQLTPNTYKIKSSQFKKSQDESVSELPASSNYGSFSIVEDPFGQNILQENRNYSQISKLESVQSISLNIIYEFFDVPNDEYYSDQWYLPKTDAPLAWDVEKGSEEVVIAVIDSGVDIDHPDLQDNLWVNSDEIQGNGIDDDQNGYIDDYYGYDFVNIDPSNCHQAEDCIQADANPDDFNGHGTHVSGIIGAHTNNSLGIAGTCQNCKIMSIRSGFSDPYGNGGLPSDAIINGIYYAADNGADIINMSFGGPSRNVDIEAAINYAYSKGSLLVAAAGNSNTSASFYPSMYDNVLSVAATDENDERASFSNYGNKIDISAPGVRILSTIPLEGLSGSMSNFAVGYQKFNGTSMAAPYVAGVAGLIKSKYPDLSSNEISNLLISGTDPIDQSDGKKIGVGRVNAFNSLYSSSDGTKVGIITSPNSSQEIKSTIDIKGYAFGTNFQKYELYYGRGENPSTFEKIVESTNQVNNNSVLFSGFNTNNLSEGSNILRVITYDNNGGSEEFDFKYSNVNNLLIESPQNNDVIRIGDTLTVDVDISTDSIKDLEYGFGEDPQSWSSDGITIQGDSFIFDTSSLTQSGIYTLRLKSEFEGQNNFESIEIILDTTLKAGWPKSISFENYPHYELGSYPAPSKNQTMWEDMDGNGSKEMVIYNEANNFYDRKLTIFSNDGSILAEKHLIKDNPSSVGTGLHTTPINIADIDGDGYKEIIVHVDRYKFINQNYVDESFLEAYSFKHDQQEKFDLLWSVKVNNSYFNKSNITTQDLNNDGNLESIIYIFGSTAKVVIVNSNGNVILDKFIGYGYDNSLISVHNVPNPLAINMDLDPELEIVLAAQYGTETRLHAIDYLTGNDLSGWPKNYEGMPFNSISAADMDDDGEEELILPTIKFGGFFSGGVYAIEKDGSILPGWPILKDQYLHNPPVLADIDYDNKAEAIIIFETQRHQFGNQTTEFWLGIFDSDGNEIRRWRIDYGGYNGVSVADIDNDGEVEIIAANGNLPYMPYSNVIGRSGVYAWDLNGNLVNGFPKFTEDGVDSSPVIADIDGDGKLELSVSTNRDSTFKSGESFTIEDWGYKKRVSFYVWDLDTDFDSAGMMWTQFLGDNKASAKLTLKEPTKKILSPQDNQNINVGELVNVELQGSADLIEIEYGVGENPSTWSSDGITIFPKVGFKKQKIADWNTTSLTEEGIYKLKISLTHNTNVSEFIVTVNVINVPEISIDNSMNTLILSNKDIVNFIGTVRSDSLTVEYGRGENPTSWSQTGTTITNNNIKDNVFATFDPNGQITQSDYYKFRFEATKNGINQISEKVFYIDTTLKQAFPVSIELENKNYIDGSQVQFPGTVQPVIGDIYLDKSKDILIYYGSPRNTAQNKIAFDRKMAAINANGEILWDVYTDKYNPVVDPLSLDLPFIIEDVSRSTSLISLTNNYNFIDENNIARSSSLIGILNSNGEWIYKLFTNISDYYPGYSNYKAYYDSVNQLYRITHRSNKIYPLREQYISNQYINLNSNVFDWGYLSASRILSQHDSQVEIQNQMIILNLDADPELELFSVFDDAFGQTNLVAFDHKLNMDFAYDDFQETQLSGWPKKYDFKVTGDFVAGDVDWDGNEDIIFPTDQGLMAIDKSGVILPSWPILNDYTFDVPLVVADMDNDFTEDLIAIGKDQNGNYTLFVVKGDGSIVNSWQVENGVGLNGPTIGDVDNDGQNEILLSNGKYVPQDPTDINYTHGIFAWNIDGSLVTGFPKITQVGTFAAPVLADIDSDDKLELIATSVFDADMTSANPVFKNQISLYVWELDGIESDKKWGTFLKDNMHSSNVKAENRLTVSPTNNGTSRIGSTLSFVANTQGVTAVNIEYGSGINPTVWSSNGVSPQSITNTNNNQIATMNSSILGQEGEYTFKIRFTLSNGRIKEERIRYEMLSNNSLIFNNIENVNYFDIGSQIPFEIDGPALSQMIVEYKLSNESNWTNAGILINSTNLNKTGVRSIATWDTFVLNSLGSYDLRFRYKISGSNQENSFSVKSNFDWIQDLHLLHIPLFPPIYDSRDLAINTTGYAKNINISYGIGENPQEWSEVGVIDLVSQISSRVEVVNIATLDLDKTTMVSGYNTIKISYEQFGEQKEKLVRIDFRKSLRIEQPVELTKYRIGEKIQIVGNGYAENLVITYSKDAIYNPSSSVGVTILPSSGVGSRLIAEIDTTNFVAGKYYVKVQSEGVFETIEISLFPVVTDVTLDVSSPDNGDVLNSKNDLVIKGSLNAQSLTLFYKESTASVWKLGNIIRNTTPNSGIIGTWTDIKSLSKYNTEYDLKLIATSTDSYITPAVQYQKEALITNLFIDNRIKSNWPLSLGGESIPQNYLHQPSEAQSSVEDLNNDGQKEIIVYASMPNSLSNFTKSGGILYVLNSNGSLKWQKDVFAEHKNTLSGFEMGIPVISNITGDSNKEIIVVNDGMSLGVVAVQVYSHDGNLLWTKDLQIGSTNINRNNFFLAATDLYQDGRKFIMIRNSQMSSVYGNETSVFIIDPTGNDVRTIKYSQNTQSTTYVPGIVQAIKFDNDPSYEIAINTISSSGNSSIVVYNLENLQIHSWQGNLTGISTKEFSMADIDDDGEEEVIIGISTNGSGLYRFDRERGVSRYGGSTLRDRKILSIPMIYSPNQNIDRIFIAVETSNLNNKNFITYVINKEGGLYSSFATPTRSINSIRQAAIGDLDNNSVKELLFIDKILYTYSHPTKTLNNSNRLSSNSLSVPIITDLDGDGSIDIVATTVFDSYSNQPKNTINVYVWGLLTSYQPNNVGWDGYMRNNERRAFADSNPNHPNGCVKQYTYKLSYDLNNDCIIDNHDLTLEKIAIRSHKNANNYVINTFDLVKNGKVNKADKTRVENRLGTVCTPTQTSIDADLNKDCVVDQKDLDIITTVLEIHMAPNRYLAKYDLNVNGTINKTDRDVLISFMQNINISVPRDANDTEIDGFDKDVNEEIIDTSEDIISEMENNDRNNKVFVLTIVTIGVVIFYSVPHLLKFLKRNTKLRLQR